MSRIEGLLGPAATLIVVVCAVIVAALLVRREISR
jgi:hypothetical protein